MPKTSALRTTRLIIISLILLLSALAGAEVLASPQDTEIVVNTPDDELNSNGNCSLREALRAANLDAAVDACPAGSGIDTIILPMGTYTMTVAGSNENEGLTGDLDINSSLNILGSGRLDTIIDGNQLDRVFHITGENIVKIGGVTIRNGRAAIGEPTEYGGGGILNGTKGDLTVSRIILTSNQADYTGGGLDNAGSATLVDVTISSNLAESGGGVYSSGNIYLRGVTFSENTATLSGGGFDNSKFATLTNVTFSGNAAPVGGGIRNDSELTLINTTLYANSTAITNELSGNVDFYNTLVAGSTEGDNCTIVGTSRSVYNLDSGDTCNFDGANDIINTDPLLGPLADNKGPTWTHAFLEGSPAIDHGDNSDCPDIDQRGASRPADGDGNDSRICDIGAYEHNGAFPNLMYLPLASR